ncbi:MAG: response regulator [Spirochaetia bacterium]|jgi:DNA-binding response OmpR family regulator|nr:response regulator [Spirochaetia bacterium]
MKKVLIIDENEEFRQYLEKKFAELNFEVFSGINGLDGSLKLRKIIPDLIVMDYMLTRKSSQEILVEKEQNPNTASIPVILLTSRIDKSRIVELAKYGVKKILSKPVKIDSLFKGVSEIFKLEVEVDDSPCIIEANYNDEIIFIEIARGLNTEKIDILQFRLNELIKIYNIVHPKILLMMSGIEIEDKNIFKLRNLLDIVVKSTNEKTDQIMILTNAGEIKDYVKSVPEFRGIRTTSNLSDALDELIGQKGDTYAQDKVVEDNLLGAKLTGNMQEGKIEMRFEAENLLRQLETIGSKVKIAIVDDDFVIRQLVKTVFKSLDWQLDLYENGKKFVEALPGVEYDLVFLDVMMPELDGFGVMEYMNREKIKTPIIILSALSQKETVLKAVKYGVRSYMTKPLKPDAIKRKTAEILNPGF